MTASQQTLVLLEKALHGVVEKSGINPVCIDVSDHSPFSDAFLIVSGRSERNVSAIAEGIEEALLSEGIKAIRREGVGLGRWELLDFGLFVAHVFHEEDREYYGLERLWGASPVLDISVTEKASAE